MTTDHNKLPGLDLQQRDFEVLCGLFESRVMAAGHIAALYFDGKREAAKKRLQKLKAAGLISERKRRVNVEARGIEPLSSSLSAQTSTCVSGDKF